MLCATGLIREDGTPEAAADGGMRFETPVGTADVQVFDVGELEG